MTIMDDWNLDETPLIKWQYLQCCKSKMSSSFLQGMANIVGLHLVSVKLHRQSTIRIEQNKENWWHQMQYLM